jgi:tetratricopeptide (TPR) repeat protein
MAMVHTFHHWDFPKAEAEFRRALKLQPEAVQTRLGYSRLKVATGELAQARQLVEEALRLDPASPSLGVEYCRLFYYQRDFRRAESECRKVLDREPGYALAHYYLALSLGMLGRLDEARAALQQSRLMPGVVEADHAWLRARAGDRSVAMAVLVKRRELMRQGTVNASAKLLLAALLDRNDEAFEALDAGIANRSPDLLTLQFEPRLDSIRQDPGYSEVLGGWVYARQAFAVLTPGA